MVGTVVLLLVYYFAWARSHFKGPQVMGGDAELTEIEREFQDAAAGPRDRLTRTTRNHDGRPAPPAPDTSDPEGERWPPIRTPPTTITTLTAPAIRASRSCRRWSATAGSTR